jgi:hypothetical protein
MGSESSVNQARKKIIRFALFSDGLWDMFFGFVFLSFAVYPMTRALLSPVYNLLIFGIEIVLLFAGWVIAKRMIVYPRIGTVKLDHYSKVNFQRLTLIIFVSFLITGALAIAIINGFIVEPVWKSLPGWIKDLDVDITFSILLILLLYFAALRTGIIRIGIYGLFLGIGNIVSTYLQVYKNSLFLYPTFISGLVIFIFGVWLFINFLRKYEIIEPA